MDFYVLLAISITQVATTLCSYLTSTLATYLQPFHNRTTMLLCTLQITLISITLIDWMRPHSHPIKKQPAHLDIQQAPSQTQNARAFLALAFIFLKLPIVQTHNDNKMPNSGTNRGLRLLLFAQKQLPINTTLCLIAAAGLEECGQKDQMSWGLSPVCRGHGIFYYKVGVGG